MVSLCYLCEWLEIKSDVEGEIRIEYQLDTLKFGMCVSSLDIHMMWVRDDD